MPRYVRYGYVVHEIVKYQGQIETAANVSFHLNPKLAQENIDSIIDDYNNARREFDTLQTVEDTTFKAGSNLVDQVIRHVLIKYLDGSTVEITLERWGVKVCKEYTMSDFDYYESALLRLRRVASYLNLRYGDVIRETKLTPVQFEILLYLDSFAPCTVTDVAQFMVVDKSTSSRVLRGIEDRGLIHLELDSEDRRRRKIRLTEEGLHLVDKHKVEWLSIEKDVRNKYDEAIEHLESA